MPRLLTLTLALTLGLTLTACSAPTGLAPGLTARMDAPGAALDEVTAFNLVNQYRATRGAPPLIPDQGLTQTARTLAAQFASTGTAPEKPAGVGARLASAGYATFAETFSGWRGAERDAGTLADPAQTHAGIAVSYGASSSYGVHWILLMAPSASQ